MNKKNFTIIELLTVFVVISILMGITIGVCGLIRDRMNVSKTRAIIKQLDIAMQSYKIDQGYYFPNSNDFTQPYTANNYFKLNFGDVPDITFIKCFEYQSFVGSKNIVSVSGYSYVKDAWGNPILYRCPGSFNTTMFDIGSLGKDGKYGDNSTDPNDFGKGDDITNFNNN